MVLTFEKVTTINSSCFDFLEEEKKMIRQYNFNRGSLVIRKGIAEVQKFVIMDLYSATLPKERALICDPFGKVRFNGGICIYPR